MKHLRSLFDLSIDEFHDILNLADSLKQKLADGQRVPINASNQPPASAQDSTPAATEQPPAPGPLALLN